MERAVLQTKGGGFFHTYINISVLFASLDAPGLPPRNPRCAFKALVNCLLSRGIQTRRVPSIIFYPAACPQVIDCGGGTVDISAFAVVSAEPAKLDQVGRAIGGPWGSTNVDMQFEGYLKVSYAVRFLGCCLIGGAGWHESRACKSLQEPARDCTSLQE